MNSTSSIRLITSILTCTAILAGGLEAADQAAPAETKPALPRLLDLGADRCIPCRQMKPILDELKRDYAAQFETVFIDVWENRDEGKRYGIHLIPTQIFFDAAGKELFRHEGFMAKKDILAKWQELGVDVTSPAPAKAATTRRERDVRPRSGDALVAVSVPPGDRSVVAP